MTLKDIIAGVPRKSPTDGPAVTVKDPDARTLAALTGAAAAPPPAAAPRAAAPAASPPAPAPAPAKDPAPAPAKDPEAEANKLLQFAETFLRAGMKDKAIDKYDELVKKYPQTEAGKTAKAKLEALGE
jgi:pyruvate/2-oxoglutarate dehydrogenase complex dihydrolipoamide acyltransferase (E2) component